MFIRVCVYLNWENTSEENQTSAIKTMKPCFSDAQLTVQVEGKPATAKTSLQ